MKKGNSIKLKIAVIISIIITIFWLLPYIYVICCSFKPGSEVIAVPPSFLPKSFSVENFTQLFVRMNAGGYLLNSLITAVCSTIIAGILGSLAAYAIQRSGAKLSVGLVVLILCLKMIPTSSIAVPIYEIICNMGLYDTRIALIIVYAIPIIVITIAVILGQATFGTFGVILSGKPLKTAMQCGFSLTQIGEFAFIIASLGVSLHVTSDFLYPIVVAVSVITTFLTPYMIRLAEPASSFVDAHLPASWRKFLMRYSSGSQTVLNHENLWKKLLLAMVRITVVYSIVSISIIALSFRFVVPFFKENLPHFWASLLGAVFIILCISPFLRAIMVKKNHSVEFMTLWHDNRANRAPLVSTIVIRIMIAALFVIFVISGLFKASIGLIIGVAVLAVLLMVWSRRLKKQSILIERRFFQNLRSREVRAEYLGEKKPEYAGRLLSHDLHLADLEIPGESTWAGKTLMELNLGKKYGIHIASILRGKRRINIPGGSVRLFPLDKIQVIGTDEQLNVFSSAMQSGAKIDWEMYEKGEMTLKQFIIDADSVFLGKTIRESGIRDKYHCMIAGVEREDGTLMVPDVNAPFEEGDVVWVVGEKENVYQLVDQKNEKIQVK